MADCLTSTVCSSGQHDGSGPSGATVVVHDDDQLERVCEEEQKLYLENVAPPHGCCLDLHSLGRRILGPRGHDQPGLAGDQLRQGAQVRCRAARLRALQAGVASMRVSVV